ncbi:hypothetical protein ACNR9Q_07725 [Maribacter sp. X9]|uniref:hypothetical protein n=1 Tax=Maribacter sp. X9 TaxID=3402159 RepID=UPI003AF38845
MRLFLLSKVCLSLPIVQDDISIISSKRSIHQGLLVGNHALGAWSYTMSNVKSPYKAGVLFISKIDGVYRIDVKFSNGILTGQDVVINGNQVKFNVNISGVERVSFTLEVEGDLIVGGSHSAKGSCQILGTRQLPELKT